MPLWVPVWEREETRGPWSAWPWAAPTQGGWEQSGAQSWLCNALLGSGESQMTFIPFNPRVFWDPVCNPELGSALLSLGCAGKEMRWGKEQRAHVGVKGTKMNPGKARNWCFCAGLLPGCPAKTDLGTQLPGQDGGFKHPLH